MNNTVAHIQHGKCTPEEWEQLMTAMHSGEQVRVHESIYWYFLEVLPPKYMDGNCFVFQEGEGDILLFGGLSPATRNAQRFETWPALRQYFASYGKRLPMRNEYAF